MQEQGTAEFCDGHSPFALPVFVVWKEVGGVKKGRVVVDLRPLNKWVLPDNYPMPLQADIIESVRGKRWITVIDATKFFYQLLVHPAYRDRFTLISHRGLERMLVAPQGFANSGAHAQRFMDTALRKVKKFCKAYIDDIIIFSDSFEEHLEHLHEVFSIFLEKGISMSPTKSFIGYASIQLLGFYVDSLGLSTTTDRIQGFCNLCFSRTLKDLEADLGSTGFLRHLIPYYAKLSEPMQKRKVALLAEGRAAGRLPVGNVPKRLNYTTSTIFSPTTEERAAFDALQEFVCKRLRLFHMDPHKQLFIQVDGSLQHGFGVMVFHLKDGFVWDNTPPPSIAVEPVMFLSKCLSSAEMNYGPSEMEVAALVWATRRLRTMLLSTHSTPVIVYTDHEATKGIVEKTNLNTNSTDRGNRRLVNASIYLSQYPLEVRHIAGRMNLVPDALSRLEKHSDKVDHAAVEPTTLEALEDDIGIPIFATPLTNLVMSEALMDDELRVRFAQGYKDDWTYKNIIADLASVPNTGRKPRIEMNNEDVVDAFKAGHPFRLVNRLLYNIDVDQRERLVIPKGLIKEILYEVHDEKHHFGAHRMLADLEGVTMEAR